MLSAFLGQEFYSLFLFSKDREGWGRTLEKNAGYTTVRLHCAVKGRTGLLVFQNIKTLKFSL